MNRHIHIALLFLATGLAWGQNPSLVLPDAPSAVQQHEPSPAASVPDWGVPPAKPEPHALEDDVRFLSNRETWHRKSLWLYYGLAISPGLLDAEISHAGLAHHKCAEAHNLNSRWQLYRNNFGEWGVELALGYVATRVKMPRWLLLATTAYPIEAHGRAAASWLGQCW